MRPITVVVVENPHSVGRAVYSDDVYAETRRDAIKLAIARGADKARFKDPDYTNQRTKDEHDEPREAAPVVVPSLAASKRAMRRASPVVILNSKGEVIKRDIVTRDAQLPRTTPQRHSVVAAHNLRTFVVVTPSFHAPTHTYTIADVTTPNDAAKAARKLHAAAGLASSPTWRVRVAS